MKMTKKFVQVHVSNDCEGRYWDWIDTEKSYDEVKNELMMKWNGWLDGVRIVEKTFNDETFTITLDTIKKAERAYDNGRWLKGKVNES